MKAVIVEEYGHAVLKDIPLRETGYEEVKVRIAYCGVGGLDPEEIVGWAVRVIEEEGATEPSCWPFIPGAWYTGHPGEAIGELTETSVHLDGFTEKQELAIYERVTR